MEVKMSVQIPKTFGKAGEGSATASGKTTLRDVLVSIVDDMTALRTSITTFTAKLDADAVLQNAAVTNSQLDENYATSCDPAALGTSYE
jgi:hypothetical protein